MSFLLAGIEALAEALAVSMSHKDIVNILSAMARLQVDNEPVFISLMLRFPPTEFSCAEWIRLTWSVHQRRPEWAQQGYFPRFVTCPLDLTQQVFEKLYVLAKSPEVQVQSYDPPVLLLPSFATPKECQELQDLAEKQGWDRTENVVRKVSVAVFNRKGTANHPLVLAIRARAAALVGLTRGFCESLNCVQYDYQERHRAHYDYVQEVDVKFAMDQPDPLKESTLLMGGQRHCTVLLYLNSLSEGEGGETYFEHLGVRLRPRRGAALVWPNVGSDGKPNPKTMHESLPAVGAEKFVVNAWLRNEDLEHLRAS